MFTLILAGIGVYSIAGVTINRLVYEAEEGRLTKAGLLMAAVVIGGYAIRFGYAVTKEAAKLTYTVGKLVFKLVSKPFRKTATA